MSKQVLIGCCLLLAPAIAGCRGRSHSDQQLWADRSIPPQTATATQEFVAFGASNRTRRPPTEPDNPSETKPTEDVSTKTERDEFDERRMTPNTEASINPVPFADNQSPIARLKEAGAILELDAHQRPVGVNLVEARISEELMQSVAELSEIQWVDMRRCRVTDSDLAILGNLPRLQLIALSDTLITDAGVAFLQQGKELRFVSLDRTAVTDAGLMRLVGLPRLEGVSVLGTLVTQAGAREFESRTPGCRVILDDNAAAGPSAQYVPRTLPPRAFPSAQETVVSAMPPAEVWPLDSNRQTVVRNYEPTQSSVRNSSGPSEIQQTRQELSAVVRRKLLDPEILEALGLHLLAQKKYVEAARTFETVLKVDPSRQSLRFNLGVALARAGQFDAALPHLTATVGEATAWYNLGVVAYEHKQPALSEQYFRRAVDLKPDFGEAMTWLAHVQRERVPVQVSHATGTTDEQALVNLLMSAFGSPMPTETVNANTSGIEIVPASGVTIEREWQPIGR